jgi:flagellar basal-body rod protein FlgB
MNAQALFQSTTIPVLEQVVDFTQSRHNVLAGNLANLDTPGYRVRDLSQETFERQLGEALRVRDQQPIAGHSTEYPALGTPYSASNPRRQDAVSGVSDRVEGIVLHDESNIGIEQQVAEMSKNQTRHNLALAILNSQFRLLEAAVSERA